MAGRAQDTPHGASTAAEKATAASDGVPRVELDYYYLGARGDKEQLTCLAVADTTSGAVGSCGTPAKGGKEANYLVEFVIATLKRWGFRDVLLHHDGEPALTALVEKVAKKREDGRREFRVNRVDLVDLDVIG